MKQIYLLPCARKGQILFCKKKKQKNSDSTKKFFETDIIKMLAFFIDNIFVMFYNRQSAYLWAQTVLCQFRCVSQGMKQIYLYLRNPLFQAHWDRCDQWNHQTQQSSSTCIWSIYLSVDTIFQRLIKLKSSLRTFYGRHHDLFLVEVVLLFCLYYFRD
jgi:hypothetical protein